MTRLVLLSVNPYRIHAYWDLAVSPAPPSPTAGVLRFYERLPDRDQNCIFDVEIDLTACNWYVDLWSSGKRYYAELGWKDAGGGFVPVVRSNGVETPKAAPQPVAQAAPEPATQAIPQAECAEARAAEAPQPIGMGLEDSAVSPREAEEAASPEFPRNRLAEIFARFESQAPLAADETLPEAYEEPPSFEWEIPFTRPGIPAPVPGITVPLSFPQTQPIDLTQFCEERFTPGVSSGEGRFGQ